MGRLYGQIRQAVADGRFVVGTHAANRLDERGMSDWQIACGLMDAKLIAERESSQPHPRIEVEQILADGSTVRVIWSWLPINEAAKLVTVYNVRQ